MRSSYFVVAAAAVLSRVGSECLVDSGSVVLLLDEHDEGDGGEGGGHEGVGDPAGVQRQRRDVEQEKEDLL